MLVVVLGGVGIEGLDMGGVIVDGVGGVGGVCWVSVDGVCIDFVG